MSEITDALEQQADLLAANVAGWEEKILQRIAKRIKKTGKMKISDAKAINNIVIVNHDMNAILTDLAKMTGQNVSKISGIYGEVINGQHNANKYLYDYRNTSFTPFSENEQLQAIVKAYTRTTAETMINLSMTKAKRLGFSDSDGRFVPLKKKLNDVLDRSVMALSSGSTDFNHAMRDTIEQLGRSGLRVDYGNNITRRLDTVIRQNLLWGAKQASIEYNNGIAEELDCDGFEVDWHSNPRPSHEFLQGRQFAKGTSKTIDGVFYQGADDRDPISSSGKTANEALNDYGCLHFKSPIILGVSIPRYSDEQLTELNERNRALKTVDGKTKTGYEWTQDMRRLETEARKEKEIISALKVAGDETGAAKHRQTLRAINKKYNAIADQAGLEAQTYRMRVYKGNSGAKIVNNTPKTLENSGGSGIIKLAANEATRNTYTKLTYNPNANFNVNLDNLSFEVNKGLSQASKKVAKLGGYDNKEYLSLIDLDSGEEVFFESGEESGVGGTDFWDFIEKNSNKKLAFIHNHNTDGYFSETDMRTLLNNECIKIFGAIRIDGIMYFAEKTTTLPGVYYFDDLLKEELAELTYQIKNGLITPAERTTKRETIIVDNLLRKYTKGLIEIDGK